MTIRNDATRLRVPQRDKRLRRGVVARQGQVLLDADLNQHAQMELGRIEAEALAVMGSPGRLVYPAGTTGFAIGAGAPPTIGTGEGYIDGWRLENADPANFATQYHPWNTALTLPALVAARAAVRHIDPVEERAMADAGLGDAQAPGRSLNDWQVLAVTVANPADPLNDPAWLAMKAASSGKLAFILKTLSGPTDICSLTPQSGYSRHENLLYRVEVHGGIVAEQRPDGPRYKLDGLQLKFSRRNASVMARVSKIDTNRITVAPAALDPRNWFAPGTCAELVNIHDDSGLSPMPVAERLFPVSQATDEEVTLQEIGAATVAATGAAAPATPADEANWFLRLWDMFPAPGGTTPSGIATVTMSGATDSAVIDLGDGITIQLTGGAAARFRRGDYWTCAVRADGTMAWAQGPLATVAEPPQGPEVRYAPLALITATGITDLRIPLATLTDCALLYRGGDGQMAPASAAGPTTLPATLRVAVMRGESPVPGARVHWKVLGPAGAADTIIDAHGATTGTDLILTTGADGISEVTWAVDPAKPNDVHQVSADLEDGLQPGTPPMIFSAGFDQEGSHGGCSTYVIAEGSDWVTLLEAMDFSQDIAVCFQRGLFKTERPVVLQGGRNIKLSGAGDGTVLLATRGETVIELDGFASAVVERLRFETRDIALGNKKNPDSVKGRNGSLTLRGCTISEVRHTTLRCGGQLVTGRTALTIAGSEERPIKLARVTDNRVITGFLQDGILVTDCEDATISGNELIAARRSAALGDAIVADTKAWKKTVAHALIDRFTTFTQARTSPDHRFLRFGLFEAEFLSPVPQGEWDKMVADMPFDGGREPSEEAVTAYLERLTERAMAEPERAPETASMVLQEAVRRSRRFAVADRQSLALATLLPGGFTLQPARRRPQIVEEGRLLPEEDGLRFGAFGVRFASPLSYRTWAQLYNDGSVYSAPAPRSADQLAAQIHGLAMALASDARLRAVSAEAANWYKASAAMAPAAARQAITCGGALLKNVTISGNRASGFASGAHVGTSVNSTKGRRSTLNARISDNDFALALPSSLHYWPSGVFLGNASTGRIDRNLLTRADGIEEHGGWRHGIRVWGEIGNYLMIAENRIEGPDIGIKVRPMPDIPDKDYNRYLWVVRDNLVRWVPTGNVLHAPLPVQDRDNRPA